MRRLPRHPHARGPGGRTIRTVRWLQIAQLAILRGPHAPAEDVVQLRAPRAHDEQLVRLGMLAERYFRRRSEHRAPEAAAARRAAGAARGDKVGLYTSREEAQYDLLRRLQDQGILPREIAQLFGEVRRAGNAASHAIVGDHRTALAASRSPGSSASGSTARSEPRVQVWPVRSPARPEGRERRAARRARALSKALAEHQAAHHEATERLASTEAKLREAKDEQTFWEQMATEAEQAKAALEQQLAAAAGRGRRAAQGHRGCVRHRATTAASAVELDEAETRKLIDEQLRAGRLDGRLRDPHLRARARARRRARTSRSPSGRRPAARPTTCSSSG